MIKNIIHKSSYKEAQFGLLFAAVSLIFCIYRYFNYDNFSYIYFFSATITFIFLSILWPSVFYYPNKIWLQLGNLIGKIMNPFILFFIYFIVIIPTAITLRLLRKDILDLKSDEQKFSYWSKKKVPTVNYEKQY